MLLNAALGPVAAPPSALCKSGAVYYTSANGVPGDADLSNPAVGMDGSTALQALVDRVFAAGGGTIVVDTATKCGNIRLPSGITIEGLGGSWYGPTQPGRPPKTGLIQAAGTECVFRNADWVSRYNGGAPVADWSLVVDHDITVENLFINGNRGTGGADNASGGNANILYTGKADADANPGRLPITPLIFFGVRDLQVRDCWIYDPDSHAILVGYADGFRLEGNTIICPQVYNNLATPANITPLGTGMVTIAGMCRDGDISDTTSYSTAVNVEVASDWGVGLTGDVLDPAYFAAVYPGPVTHVAITHNDLVGALPVWLWSGNSTADHSFQPSSLIDGVTVRHLRGMFFQAPLGFADPAPTVGTHGTEVWDDVSLKALQTDYPIIGSYFEAHRKSLLFRNVTIDLSGVNSLHNAFSGNPTLFTGPLLFWFSGIFGSVRFDGLTIHDPTNLTYDVVQVNFRVADLSLSRVRVVRTDATARGSLVHTVSVSADIGTLRLDNVVLDGVSNAVLYDQGVIGEIDCDRLVHLRSGGAPSIYIGSGLDLDFLRARACLTAELVGGPGKVLNEQIKGVKGH